MKCIDCDTGLVEYEGSNGESLKCLNCKLVYNAEYMKQAYPTQKPKNKDYELEALITQKDNAYTERNKCVAALANVIYSIALPKYRVYVTHHPEEDESWDNDWRTILVIEYDGFVQMTWHFHDSEKNLLKRFPVVNSYKWDGHTTDEKYNRLQNLFIGA